MEREIAIGNNMIKVGLRTFEKKEILESTSLLAPAGLRQKQNMR